MSTPNDGGAAFPWSPLLGYGGMSLRDYFAGQVLSGMMANSDLPDLMKVGWVADTWCGVCYVIADAMLKARKRGA